MKRYGFYMTDDNKQEWRELQPYDMGGYVLAGDVTRWIPISEAQPAYNVNVLVTDGKEVCLCVRDRTDAEGDHYEDGRHEEFHDVTHWMALPELPT
jgi:hypothetical protein